MRREWIEIWTLINSVSTDLPSPSMRREWIEMNSVEKNCVVY